MQLTTIQYNAIMQAINNAKGELLADTFIDPYGEAIEGWTNENVLAALEQIEDMIIDHNIPS